MDSDFGRTYAFGSFTIDTRQRELRRDGEPLRLQPKAVDVLLALVERHGKIVSKRELIDVVWGDTHVTDGNLSLNIFQIRHALGDSTEDARFIETLPRRGYRFIAPVREVIPEPAVPVARRFVLSRRWAQLLIAAASVLVVLLVLALASGPPLRVVRYTELTHERALERSELYPLLVDESHIYFRQNGQAVSVEAKNGQAMVLPAPLKDFELYGLNSQRSEFLAIAPAAPGAPGDVWTVSKSGATTRVPDLRCYRAAWSPDERRIACTHDNALVVANLTTGIRTTVPLPGGVFMPRWSPDGTVVRFTVSIPGDRTSRASLWEVRADGSGLRPLLPEWSPHGECCGVWTPDGRFFVFQASVDDKSDLWAIKEQGFSLIGGRRPFLLTDGRLSYTSAASSVDGHRLFALGAGMHGELARYDSRLAQFVPYLDGRSAVWVTYSPRDEWVAYVGIPDRTLWRARPDGTERQQLTLPPFDVDGAVWSPDGAHIAFRGSTPGMRKKIYLIPATGGVPQPLTDENVEQGIATWSPDGKRLVFGDVPAVFGQPDGTEVIHLHDIESGKTSAIPGSKGRLWTSRWSPDGRSIFALTIKGQRGMLFDVATEQWREFQADHISSPVWSRDGRYIYHDTEGPLTHALRRLRVADGVLEEIAGLQDPPADNNWIGLAPDGSPVVLAKRYSVQIYALDLERR